MHDDQHDTNTADDPPAPGHCEVVNQQRDAEESGGENDELWQEAEFAWALKSLSVIGCPTAWRSPAVRRSAVVRPGCSALLGGARGAHLFISSSTTQACVWRVVLVAEDVQSGMV